MMTIDDKPKQFFPSNALSYTVSSDCCVRDY